MPKAWNTVFQTRHGHGICKLTAICTRPAQTGVWDAPLWIGEGLRKSHPFPRSWLLAVNGCQGKGSHFLQGYSHCEFSHAPVSNPQLMLMQANPKLNSVGHQDKTKEIHKQKVT